MNQIQVIGVPVDNVTMDEAIGIIKDAVETQSQKRIYFVNTYYLNIAWENPVLHAILNEGDYVFGDGAGVYFAAKFAGETMADNVNGTDMIFPLCELCRDNGYGIFFLGAKEGVAAKLKLWAEEHFPGIRVAGHHHGHFDWDAERDTLVRQINEAKTDILLVGFSAPRQEQWIQEHAHLLDCKVLMGVGGLFDVYAGDIRRPHRLLRKYRMEWVGRLFQEPTRLWKRYLIGNPLFLWRAFWWNLKHGRKAKA